MHTGDENVLEIKSGDVWTTFWIYQNYWYVHFKSVNFMVYELYLNEKNSLAISLGAWELLKNFKPQHAQLYTKKIHRTTEKVPSPKLPKVKFDVPIMKSKYY